jgi:hypothetical protein
MHEDTMKDDWPAWLTRRETSDYLWQMHGVRLGHSALTQMAVKGNGPAFSKDGRLAVYARTDVDAWARQRRSPTVRSTRELRRIRAEAVDMEAA